MPTLGFALAAALCAQSLCAQNPTFNRDVLPILADKCFACHGPDRGARKAKLRLDRPEGAFATRKHGRAIVPGKAAASLVWQRITSRDPKQRMPPAKSHKRLEPREIDVLRRWIDRGAHYEAHWSYIRPRAHAAPQPRAKAWRHNIIDRWISARLEREGIEPSPAADPVTLVRRVFFDLTGLPPTPEDVDAFVRDDSPRPYEALVDRLLASPAFGERLASYWFDLVRFADTVGYHGDQEHQIGPYRDWVIDAFNANMPFDRFTIAQLAGDLLPDPSEDQIIATGYNRVLQTTHEGGAQAKEYLAIYAADRVRNFGSVWLGLTTGCAQCHDHKFDPITQRDFYRLSAFFADIEEKGDFAGSPNTTPTTRPPELVTASGRRTMITRAVEPRPTRVLARGNWMDETGEIVQPGVPAFLPQVEADRRLTRLDLARWLFRSDNPLTARVFVNRIWYLLFGRGLAEPLDDLGVQGHPPLHAELLDALALSFRDSGWDIKQIVRSIVMSNTYRQASLPRGATDPRNRFFARQGRWRLPAEAVRDSLLAVSGLLVRGKSKEFVKPRQPRGYYKNLNFPPRRYHADKGADQWRRSVYMHWQRQFLHPMLKAFDAPTREECCAERPRSNTPQAALTLLGDPSCVAAAIALAKRVLREADTRETRIERGFELVTSRPPTEAEAAVLVRLLSKQHDELAAWTSLARVLLNLAETTTRN